MTTRTLHGIYSSGYTLSAACSALVNYGRVVGAAGGAGVTIPNLAAASTALLSTPHPTLTRR